jgi:hypothetical protein
MQRSTSQCEVRTKENTSRGEKNGNYVNTLRISSSNASVG